MSRLYLLSQGGTHPRTKTSTVVSGVGLQMSAEVFYYALRDYMLSNDGYSAARDKTARVAQERYGIGSAVHVSTCAAWDAVGVPDAGSYCPVPFDWSAIYPAVAAIIFQ